MRLFATLALSIAAVSMTFAQSSSKQVFPGANPAMPFAAAVKADGLIYVSGTLGSGGDINDAVAAISAVSERSLAAGFVFWGHRTFIEYLLQSPNAALRDCPISLFCAMSSPLRSVQVRASVCVASGL